MEKLYEKVGWAIVSKDRLFVVKGTASTQEIVRVNDDTHRKNILIYETLEFAEVALKPGSVRRDIDTAHLVRGFQRNKMHQLFEPVKVRLIVSYED